MNDRTLSHIGWIIIIVIMIITTSTIAGCMTNVPSGSSVPQPQNTKVTTTPTTPAVPTVTLNRPAPGSVKAVDFNLLIPLLPNAPAGWAAVDPEGIAIPEQDGSWTIASRSYSNGANKQAEVSVMDSAYYNVGGWEGWASLIETTSNDGYVKTGTVAGFPSWESYDKNDRSYVAWIGLNNRYMVTVTITNGEKSDLDLFVNSINYPGIAALK